MQKYTKIQTLFKRCTEKGPDKNKLIEGDWTLPEFEILKDVMWDATEKIDGTNISVIWNRELEEVEFAGRDENAQIPARLVNYLIKKFKVDRFLETDLPSMIIYGEGYGDQIQKVGKDYIPDGVSLKSFDVFCAGLWLERKNLEDISEKLFIDPVPSLGPKTLNEAIGMASAGFESLVGENLMAEGLVLRAPCGVLTRQGERLITKIKTKDFTKGLVEKICSIDGLR